MSTFFPNPHEGDMLVSELGDYIPRVAETPSGRHVLVAYGGDAEHVFYAQRPIPADLGAARITLVAAAQDAGIDGAAADISVERHDDGLCLTLFRSLPDGTTVHDAAHAPDVIAWRRLCDESAAAL